MDPSARGLDRPRDRAGRRRRRTDRAVARERKPSIRQLLPHHGPYVDAWKVSKHREVARVQCHCPPGLRDTLWVKFQAISQVAKWATQTYNSSRGVLTFGRGVRFDHRPHLEPAKMGRQHRCTSCHSQIVGRKHFEVTTSTCFTWHFKGTRTTTPRWCRGSAVSPATTSRRNSTGTPQWPRRSAAPAATTGRRSTPGGRWARRAWGVTTPRAPHSSPSGPPVSTGRARRRRARSSAPRPRWAGNERVTRSRRPRRWCARPERR